MADGFMADKDRLLFICVGNTCRSQMAEGFARTYAGPAVGIRSAGTSAMGCVHGSTIEAMAEVGIDITSQTSDQLTPEMIDWATVVVTLGCAPADILCPPSYPGVKLDWPVRDPLGMPVEFIRTVRDEIQTRVKALIDGLQ
jgi:protein-tyrosine-phosphatase